jgi:hypothetical protein
MEELPVESTSLLARIFDELPSREHEDGRATWQPRAAQALAPRAGCRFRGVPERHVVGADTRGRQEGRPYPWSQQVIHQISGLPNLSFSSSFVMW